MALNINILSAIDWTSGLGRKFRRKEGEALAADLLDVLDLAVLVDPHHG